MAAYLEDLGREDLERTGQLMGIITGHWRTLAVATAVKLRIFDHLAAEPRCVRGLAAQVGSHEHALRRLLRALASFGLVAEPRRGEFAIAPLGAPLQRGHRASLVPVVELATAPFHWDSWCGLAEAVRTGQSAFEARHGETLFSWLSHEREAGQLFDAWMTRLTGIQVPALLAAYDFEWAQTVVDVGGGDGALLRGLLTAYPGMKGVLFDMPSVIESLPNSADPRMRIIGGDMFLDVPQGGDLYILKTVLHDWHDEACIAILRNCARCLSASSRLLIIEMVMPTDGRPGPAYFMDLNMLVLNHGGLERTEAEYKSLCERAGLRLSRLVHAPGGLGLMEVLPVEPVPAAN